MSCAVLRSTLPPALVTAVLLLTPATPAVAQSKCPPLASAQSAPGVPGSATAGSDVAFECRFDAALTRMFTPASVRAGTYRVYVTDTGIDQVAAAFRRAAPSSTESDGAWTVQDVDPLDAYGESGIYDRAKVARLYVGVRAHVARGPIVRQEGTVASITLVSPYPDASLRQLRRGTLIIAFRIPQGDLRNQARRK